MSLTCGLFTVEATPDKEPGKEVIECNDENVVTRVKLTVYCVMCLRCDFVVSEVVVSYY